MIRQAQTYFVGAMSGTVLIGVAIAVFVLLVSAQVFHAWPVVSLGGSNSGKTQVFDARAVSHAPAQPAASSIAAARANARAAAATTPVQNTASHAKSAGNPGAASGSELAVAKPDTSTGLENPLSTGGEPASSPGSSGFHGAQPSNPGSPAPSSPAPTSGGSGGSGGGETGGGGGGTERAPNPPPTSTSKAVTETVNKTVTGVDETVTGGALGETGVTQATEEVVNGVAGPESVVGQTVDEAGNALGGLLSGGK